MGSRVQFFKGASALKRILWNCARDSCLRTTCMTGTTKEQSNSEKIRNLIHTVSDDTVFKSFKELYNYFGLKPKNENTTNIGSHSRNAILDELSRHCTCEKMEKSNKYIITKVFDFPLPKIDEKFLSSKLYPPCFYLLLVFLAERYSHDENEKSCYLTQREIMEIISICNNYYGNAYSNSESIEEELNKDSESIYFKEIALSYLYKLTQRILESLQSRNFLTFDEVIMVKYIGKEAHEAIYEEKKIIDEYYIVISKEYGIKKKSAIRLSKNRKEIYEKIDEHLGFKHYKAIKFNLTADLASNAEYLRGMANLADNCGSVVNSLVCSEIYNLVFNGIIKINPLLVRECTEEYINEHVDKMIKEFIENGVCICPSKFIKQWHFNLDVNVVISRIESLIKLFIRADA